MCFCCLLPSDLCSVYICAVRVFTTIRSVAPFSPELCANCAPPCHRGFPTLRNLVGLVWLGLARLLLGVPRVGVVPGVLRRFGARTLVRFPPYRRSSNALRMRSHANDAVRAHINVTSCM